MKKRTAERITAAEIIDYLQDRKETIKQDQEIQFYEKRYEELFESQKAEKETNTALDLIQQAIEFLQQFED